VTSEVKMSSQAMKNSSMKPSSSPFFISRGEEWLFSIFKEWDLYKLQRANKIAQHPHSLKMEDGVKKV